MNSCPQIKHTYFREPVTHPVMRSSHVRLSRVIFWEPHNGQCRRSCVDCSIQSKVPKVRVTRCEPHEITVVDVRASTL
jgi:hypothetical protein